MPLRLNPITGVFEYAPASEKWKDPVASYASLPVSGNGIGDIRITLDTKVIYEWEGSTWVNITNPPVKINTFTLTTDSINQKYILLTEAPAAPGLTRVVVDGGPEQLYGESFVVTSDDGGRRLSWSGYFLEQVLEIGDRLVVIFS